MNTRLQVEHPVTECITGLDLVEQMIRIAAGEKLAFTQRDVKIDGWALESRVYAEDPLRGFLPSIGVLRRYVEPTGSNVRVDSGVVEGSEISIHYDPMISKLITFGKDRNEALAHMRTALDSYVIRGLTHNINFLRSLCDHPRFIEGRLSTNFIPDEYPQGYKGAQLTEDQRTALIAAAVLIRSRTVYTQASISDKLPSFDANTFHRNAIAALHVRISDTDYVVRTNDIDINETSQKLSLSLSSASDEKQTTSVKVESPYALGQFVMECKVDDRPFVLQVMDASESGSSVSVQLSGTSFTARLLTPLQHRLYAHMPKPVVIDTSKMVLSPMPGAVFSIKVREGDQVVIGQEVCVIEAMKMQNALRAATNGKIKKISVKQGETVKRDQVLIELE